MAMAASVRRVGAETSETRETLLKCVETMMLEEGYASVSYRALAARADLKPSLVQYYFPTLDDIFVAAIRRYSKHNLDLLADALQARSEDPLRALWEYSWDEATSALMTEFMALGNHRKSIRAEIAEVTEQVRAVQLKALTAKYGAKSRPDGQLSLPAMLLMVTGFPKFLNLEESIGVKTAHKEVVQAFESYLDRVEPRVSRKRRPSRPRR
jgi:AcrR family transcriptional regulator